MNHSDGHIPRSFVPGLVIVSPRGPHSSGDIIRGVNSAWNPVGHGARTVPSPWQSRRGVTRVTVSVGGLQYCYPVVFASATQTCLFASFTPCCKGTQSQCLRAAKARATIPWEGPTLPWECPAGHETPTAAPPPHRGPLAPSAGRDCN